MDDSMDSKSATQKPSKYTIIKIWGIAGMDATKWIRNSVAEIKQILEEDTAAETELRNEEFPFMETLRLTWKRHDILIFKYNLFSSNNDRHTKY